MNKIFALIVCLFCSFNTALALPYDFSDTEYVKIKEEHLDDIKYMVDVIKKQS